MSTLDGQIALVTGASRGIGRAIASDHPDAVYAEVGPGNVLAGLMKKCVPGAEVMPCGTAADVEALLTRLS